MNKEVAYEGWRKDGERIVLRADGTELPNAREVYNHSPDNFEWGYHGSGPSQLALAIAVDWLRDKHLAISCYQDFKERVIARIKDDHWTLTKAEVELGFKGLIN